MSNSRNLKMCVVLSCYSKHWKCFSLTRDLERRCDYENETDHPAPQEKLTWKLTGSATLGGTRPHQLPGQGSCCQCQLANYGCYPGCCFGCGHSSCLLLFLP